MLEKETIFILERLIKKLEHGFDLPHFHSPFPEDYEKLEKVLTKTAELMQDNYPYFHPLYAGQMIKPPHPVARLAYMMSLWINPNNHAFDGGKASSKMEKEVVADLAKMFGWSKHLGHLTGGGTLANLEALWISGKLHPDKYIVGSDQAHYTHKRISDVLKLPYQEIGSDPVGRMDLEKLEDKLSSGKVGTVIVTMGTTGTGSVDPLNKILRLQEKFEFRIHADAAYGGYFKLVSNLSAETTQQFELLSKVDSIVIDPHKHGLQPYGCGCILYKDPEINQFYLHDSPYTYYTSEDIHLGEISLECSRPGAAAVSLWATHQLMPPVKKGKFASQLGDSRTAAKTLYKKIEKDERLVALQVPELDIVVWAIKASGTEEMSELARRFFKKAEENKLYLSLFNYPARKIRFKHSVMINSETLTCLRSCLMKPEHLSWMDELWERIDRTMNDIM